MSKRSARRDRASSATPDEELVITEAVAADARRLTTMHKTLVPEAGCDFAARINAQHDRRDPYALTLVARRGIQIVGYLCWGSWIDSRTGVETSYREVPWVKLHALGVGRREQGRGVADALLQAAARRLPDEIVGIFGNVSLDRPRAIHWYRRRGFSVGVAAELVDAQGVGLRLVVPDQLLAIGTGREVHFTARAVDLLFAPQAWTVEREQARAQVRLERMRATAVPVPPMPTSADLAARVAEALERAQPCEHNAVCGPQASALLAYDPEMVVACLDWCGADRDRAAHEALSGTVYDFRCDACGTAVVGGSVDPYATQRGAVLVVLALCEGCADIRAQLTVPESGRSALEVTPEEVTAVRVAAEPRRRRWWRRRRG